MRCPTEEEDPPSFIDRLRCCIGDLGEADRKSADIERSQAFAQRNQLGVAAYKLEMAPQFDDDDAAVIVSANTKLTQAAGDFMKARASTKGSSETRLLDEQVLRTALDEMHAVGAATARFHLLPGEEREKVLSKHQKLGDALEKNQEALEKFSPMLETQADKVLASTFERTMARSVIAETVKYSNPNLEEADRKTAQAYVYAYNGVSTAAANNQVHQAMADFKAWLLRKLDECPPTGQCCLGPEINAIQIPTGEEVTEETYRAAEKLVRALIRYLLDCICSALLPPCPTCDDPAVKLACLQIDDCNVCEICNLERTFLLTEHNLRYWIPLLHSFGEALERLCCEFADRFKLRYRQPQNLREDLPVQHVALKKQTAFFKSGNQLGEIAASNELFPNIVRLTGLELDQTRSALNMGGNFARITARDPVITSIAARYTDTDAARLAGRNAFAKAFEASPAPEILRTEVERTTSEVVDKKVDARLKELNADFEKRLNKVTESMNKRLADIEKRKTP